MAKTYTWRATDGKYFSSSGSSSTIDNHVYYSSNRAFRMDYPDLGGLLGKDKKTMSIQSAILHVYITDAHSATLTIGYSYDTAFANRKTLLAQRTGISMNTSTGAMDIDLTDVIKAYVKDGTNSTMRLWGYGTGGSSSNSRFRGINPSSSYTSQRPYLQMTYNEADTTVWYNDSGNWKECYMYYYDNGTWRQVMPYYNSGGIWLPEQ